MMKLKLVTPYESIREMPDCDLPSLVIVHGPNGAGKSHMLRALSERHIEAIEGETVLSSVYVSDFLDGDPLTSADPSEGRADSQFGRLRAFLTQSPAIQEMVDRYVDPDVQWAYKTQHGGAEIIAEMAVQKAAGEDRQVLNRFSEDLLSNMVDYDGELYAQLQEMVARTGLNLFEVAKLDCYQIVESDLLYPKLGALFRRYWLEWVNNKRNQIKFGIHWPNSLSDEDFIRRFGQPPWDTYNRRLRELGFDFKISEPPDDPKVHWYATLEKSGINLSINQLSSGERVILSLALSVVAAQDAGLATAKPDIVLLDEPDAHLHPSLVSLMFKEIIEPLLSSGTKVVLTTHSPTTVAQSPDGALFEKVPGGGLEPTTKQVAIDKLLVGVPHIAIDPGGRRQVFVESSADEEIYEDTYTLLRDSMPTERSLSFIAAGAAKDGGKDRVKAMVSALRSAQNRSIFGLIDWDTVEPETSILSVIGWGGFYSIENIVLNPVAVGSLMVKYSHADEFQQFNYLELSSCSQERLQELACLVEARMPRSDTVDNFNFVMCDGRSVCLKTQLMSMNGHDYETLLRVSLPRLNEIAKNNGRSLKRAVSRQIFRDVAGLIPADFRRVFDKILSA